MSWFLASSVEKDEFDHTHMPRPFLPSAFRDSGAAKAVTTKMITSLRMKSPQRPRVLKSRERIPSSPPNVGLNIHILQKLVKRITPGSWICKIEFALLQCTNDPTSPRGVCPRGPPGKVISTLVNTTQTNLAADFTYLSAGRDGSEIQRLRIEIFVKKGKPYSILPLNWSADRVVICLPPSTLLSL